MVNLCQSCLPCPPQVSDDDVVMLGVFCMMFESPLGVVWHRLYFHARGKGEKSELVIKLREVTVALGSQLSLSRTRSKVYLSRPASQQVQSLRGVNYFLHLKGGCVGLGWRLLHPKNADFSIVLMNFKVWCLGSSLPVQNQFL